MAMLHNINISAILALQEHFDPKRAPGRVSVVMPKNPSVTFFTDIKLKAYAKVQKIQGIIF